MYNAIGHEYAKNKTPYYMRGEVATRYIHTHKATVTNTPKAAPIVVKLSGTILSTLEFCVIAKGIAKITPIIDAPATRPQACNKPSC